MASIFTPKSADLSESFSLPPTVISGDHYSLFTEAFRKRRRLLARVNTLRAAEESIRETNTDCVDRAFVAASVPETELWRGCFCFFLTARMDEEDRCDRIGSPEVSLNCVFAS